MRAYSVDLRKRVVLALESGIKQQDVAERFAISIATVRRFAQLHRTGANLQGKKPPGRKRCISTEQEARFLEEFNALENPTVVSLAKRWQEITGKYIAKSTVHLMLQRLNYRYKKNKNSDGA